MAAIVQITVSLADVDRARLDHIIEGLRAVRTQGAAMTDALGDLQAADADLATAVAADTAAVNDLSDHVARIDADFAALETAVSNGDSAAIETEVANVRAAITAAQTAASTAQSASAAIDAADPAPAPVAEPAPADGPADAAPADPSA